MAAPTPIRSSTKQASLPPHDEALERRALGSFILKPRLLNGTDLREEDFYGEAHRYIWRALVKLAADGGDISTVALYKRLEAMGKLARVGDLDYLLGLTGASTDEPPTAELRELTRAREVRALGIRLQLAAEKSDMEDARAALEAGGELLREPAPATPPYQTLAQMATTALRPVGLRLTTGFPSLDTATRGGIPLGRFVVGGGGPGSGKTSLAAQLTDSFEQQGCAVVYLAADEPAEGIITRLGQLAGFSREGLESEGTVGESIRAGFAGRAEGRAIVVIDPDASEATRTIEDAERVLLDIACGRPSVLVIDSLQTAQCRASETFENQRERIDAKLAVLKAIAKRGTLVLALTEMARSGYRSGDRSQDTSALAASKESGGIEYSASLLLGLRSAKGEHGLVDVEVAKNRLGGAKPEFRMQLDHERARFEEIEMPDREEQRRASADSKALRFREAVAAAVRADHNLTTKDALWRATGLNRTETFRAINELLELGQMVVVNKAFRLNLTSNGGRDA